MWFVVGVFFHFCVFCSLCVLRFLCVHACVLRCGFSLIFERGLEEDICFLRITQKSTWFQRDITYYTYKDKEAFEPKWTFLRFNGCWVFIENFSIDNEKNSIKKRMFRGRPATNVIGFNRKRKSQITATDSFFQHNQTFDFSANSPEMNFISSHSPPIYPLRPHGDTYREIRAAT